MTDAGTFDENILRRFADDASIIVTDGYGPCPVFARGDRRSAPTHWLSRAVVKALQADGILTTVPRGLTLSKTARKGA